MEKPVLFSVIIPTYNRASLLKKAIQSVINQTYQEWELIIVDDGSTDKTLEVVNSYSTYNINYIYQDNQKLSAARNKGVKNAKGKYICFLDDDDYYMKNHLQVFFDWLLNNNYPKTILRTAIKYKTKNNITEGPLYDRKLHKNPVYFAAFNFCGTVSLCIPVECFEEDQFIIGTEPWEDTHFILRIFSKYSFVQLPFYTYMYIKHRQMGSNKIYTDQDTLKMAIQNTNAMKHLFNKYDDLIRPFLPKCTLSYLTSEKFSQHSFNAVTYGKFKLGWQLFRLAIKEDKGIYQWKKYLKILILFPVKFFTGYPNRDHLI